MNVFDQFVKHVLRVRYYIRYADDFVLFSHNRRYLTQILPLLQDFLRRELILEMHPNKIKLKTVASGVDFLGWVHFPQHRALRTTTKRRMLHVMENHTSDQTVASYKGMTKHGDAFEFRSQIDVMITDQKIYFS
jgi:hypothetical protein